MLFKSLHLVPLRCPLQAKMRILFFKFFDFNNPYPAEFGLPYVVLASTTACSKFYYVKQSFSEGKNLPFSNPCILWPLGKLTSKGHLSYPFQILASCGP